MTQFTLSAFADEASPEFDRQIAALHRKHIPLMEIRGVDGKGILDLTDEELDVVEKKLAAGNIGISAIGSPIGKIGIEDDFAPHFEKFKRAVEIAKKLHTTRIRMFSFYIPEGKNPEIYHDTVIERIQKMVDYSEANGVHCCHENEKGIYGDVASRCKELLDLFPALVGVFDPANFIQCGQDTWEAWELLASRTYYMHIKDALADGNVVPAGHGIGQVKRILDAYRAQGGTAVTIEPHLQVFSGLQGLEREGEKTQMGAYCYENSDAAFDAACAALRALC